MCERICKTCGGDDAVAKIAERMGFRPDIAFARIKELEKALGDLLEVAERCDGWSNFPATALDAARDVLRR